MPASPDYPELEQARDSWRYQPAANCLADKVIVVTGAGDGIGKAAARTFAVYGAHVVLLGRTRSKLESVFDWISEATRTRPVIVPCDLSNLQDENAEALADAIEESYGRLDGVLHNASMLGVRLPIVHYSSAEWRSIFEVNTFAVFALTKALLPLLNRSESASVVVTSSSVGRQGRAYWGAYAASKFAAEGFAQVLADEHEHAGRIRVNSLNPGGTRTAMRQAAYPAEDPRTVPTAESRMDLYLYLLEDASHGVTGRQFDARDWQGPDTDSG